MKTYIRQHIITPPLEMPKKKLRRKMRTFSKRKTTQRAKKTQLGQVSLLLKGAYAQLQKNGQYLEQTIEYPLALCSEYGELRVRHKSAIKDVFQNTEGFEGMFFQSVPFDMMHNCEVIIDFLRYIHEPTPPDLMTYQDLTDYLWTNVILKLGFNRGASTVTVIVDKTDYLPPVRNIVYAEKKAKSKNDSSLYSKYEISDSSACLHGSDYSAALHNMSFKQKLIDYVTSKFNEKALLLNPGQTLILDTPTTKTVPLRVSDGQSDQCSERKNNKGEADYAIWFHACQSKCDKILVTANDCDIWMYGLAILEAGFLIDKDINIELCFGKEYIYLNTALTCIRTHGSLVELAVQRTAAMSLLAIYLLSGSDYLSNFYGLTIKKIVDVFFKYTDHISTPDDPLIVTEKTDGHTLFKRISLDGLSRLMCIQNYTSI